MSKKVLSVMFFVIAVVLTATYFVVSKNNTVTPQSSESNASDTKDSSLLGGDRDENGCIPSAGYSWCEEKQKCLRIWEEPCETTAEITAVVYDTEQIAEDIKKALVAKHGNEAEKLTITVSKVTGNYAKGGASQIGMGGGMWFATNVNNSWVLVWDGNGIITCEDLLDYPDFPSSMIPECYDKTSGQMTVR